MREAEGVRRPGDRRLDGGIEESRPPASDGRRRDRQPEPLGVSLRAGEERRLHRVELAGVERAELERETRLPRDDVEGSGVELETSDRPDGAGEVAQDELAHAEEEARCARSGVGPRVHRRRPGVVRVAVEHELEGAVADDPADDADVDTGALEPRPLLDVELEVARESRRVAARAGEALLAQPGPGETGAERVEAASGREQSLGPERPGQRLAPEQADERALLVREVDRLEVHRKLLARVLRGAEHLEGRDDAERPVEAAPVRNGVEMGAEEERAGTWAGRQQDGRVVSRRVDPHLEPGLGRPLEEPAPGGQVRLAERRPADAALRRRADLRERVEVGPQAFGVDHSYPRSRNRPRPGAPTNAPSSTITSPRLIVVVGNPRTVTPS